MIHTFQMRQPSFRGVCAGGERRVRACAASARDKGRPFGVFSASLLALIERQIKDDWGEVDGSRLGEAGVAFGDMRAF